MNRLSNLVFLTAGFFLILILSIENTLGQSHNKQIKVLLLSGKNNHEWQKTTPLLQNILENSGICKVTVTNLPDTLTFEVLKKFNVIVCNWNSWPDNDFRLDRYNEEAFENYVKKGGGMVFFHASASSFYAWPEYHRMGIGRWGKETHHGSPTLGKVIELDQSHPVTKGISEFFITDEIWEKTDLYPEAKVLAIITANDLKDGHFIREPAVFVNQVGKGKCFYTTMGHNEHALLNAGLQTLLVRATLWTAGRNIPDNLPVDLKLDKPNVSNKYGWMQTDTSLSLLNRGIVVWQYNFNNRFGKPYFHPICTQNSTLTCVSPPDHPWHLGLWFSWKFINKINYWEYLPNFNSDKTGYRSEGKTIQKNISIEKKSNFSSVITQELQYQGTEMEPVLSESRTTIISSPLPNGSYYIDFDYVFIALAEKVILDRTPTENEPDGKSWGGYAGLSIRFNQGYTMSEVIKDNESEQTDKWQYMGFNTLSGKRAGICIFQHPEFSSKTSRWYTINNPEIPFYYFSPAALYEGSIMLLKGEKLNFKYRVWILPGEIKTAELKSKYIEYITAHSTN